MEYINCFDAGTLNENKNFQMTGQLYGPVHNYEMAIT